MSAFRLSSSLALMLCSLLPSSGLCAQTPLFTDGPAFGGSKVFSEGLNPLGNSARIGQAHPGWYFTYAGGDQSAQDNASLLQGASSTDPASLLNLQNAPWAQKTRSFGIAGIKEAANLAFTREEFNSLMAYPDVAPTDAGAANTTTVLGRRANVNRISFGGNTTDRGSSLGMSLRLEQWENGLQTAALNPTGTQLPMTNLTDSLLGFSATSQKTLTYGLDMGFTMDLAEGLRVGLTADQLNPKRLWDVNLQPQFRAGVQFDLGSLAKLALETDLNAAARMPFPEKEQTASASLSFTISSAVTFAVGAERRKIGDMAVTRGGATLRLRTSAFLLGIGFQAGQDTPLRGATLMVN